MKEKVFSFVRTLLVALGVFFIGTDLKGWQITEDVWQSAIGVLMSVGGLIWAIIDKTIVEDQFISFVKAIIIGIGGAMVALGVVTLETFNYISGFILVLAPYIWGLIERKKAAKVRANLIQPNMVVGARPKDSDNLF